MATPESGEKWPSNAPAVIESNTQKVRLVNIFLTYLYLFFREEVKVSPGPIPFHAKGDEFGAMPEDCVQPVKEKTCNRMLQPDLPMDRYLSLFLPNRDLRTLPSGHP